MRRAKIRVAAAVMAAALWACQSDTPAGPGTPLASAAAQGGLTLGPDTTITVSDTARFQVVNSIGTPVPRDQVQWTSSAPQVAGVLADGRVVGLQPGNAVITAQGGSWSLTRNVTVSLPGGRIVFRSETPQAGLYGARPDGTGRFLVYAPSWAAYSDLSPDGRWVVYAGGFTPGRVGVQPIDGSEWRTVFEGGQVVGVSWSRAGDRIVVAARSEADEWRFQLFVADTAGNSVTQITHSPGDIGFPAWSPDGTRIAYSTIGPADRDVWIVDADGSDPVQVTGPGASETHPAWISDTRLVIARGETATSPLDIYLVDIDGTDLVQLTDDPVTESWPHPSPDGRWVVFWKGGNIATGSLAVVHVDGGGPFPVATPTSGQRFPCWGPEPGPASAPFSPLGPTFGGDTTITVGDTAHLRLINPGGTPVPGSAVAWTSSAPQVANVLADGRVATLQLGRAVITAQLGQWTLSRTVTVGLPGGRIVFRSLTPEDGLYAVRPDGTGRFRIVAPSWADYSDPSPDGRWIAYAGDDPGIVGVQPIDGTEPRILFDRGWWVRGVSWSPAGDRVVFAARSPDEGETFQLFVADTAGTSVTQITHGPVEAAFPAWSPDATRIAFSTLRGPRKVWIVDADGGRPMMVSGDNDFEFDTHPAWISNTGLVIGRALVPSPDFDFYLYLVNDDGTNPVQLTSGSGSGAWPRPSPDRRWVVFIVPSFAQPNAMSVVRVDGLGPFHVSTVTSGGGVPSWGREP